MSGDAKQTVGLMSLEFWGEARTGDVDLRVKGMWMELKVTKLGQGHNGRMNREKYKRPGGSSS